jgi:predicted DNA-binding transcriptional regulator AlpA
MAKRRPRRVSRGYRGFKQYAGDGETRIREIIAEGTHPRPMKGAVSYFEDEIVEWQRQRASTPTIRPR